MRGIILIVILSAATVVWSHGGRTNSAGCHNDRKNVGYHCHNSGLKSKSRTKARSFLDKSNKNFTCSGKTVCKQMASCDEAKFYLKECKVHSLDRDSDNIPCESICGG